MELSLALMKDIASMLLWIILGYVVVRTRLVRPEDSRVLSVLTVYVFCPCMIFGALQIELTKARLHGFLSVVGFAFVVYAVWILLTRLLKKPLHLDPVDSASLVYGNVGNLVIPLVGMTLGEEMMFYASAMQIPFNLFFWTHGISIMQEQPHVDWKKLLRNPNIFAVVLGLLFLAFQWHLPPVLDTTVSGLGRVVLPTSMMVIGMVLAGTSLKSVFANGKAYAIAAGRLVLFPLIALLVLFLSGVPARHPELVPVLMVPFLAQSAPAAANVAQLAVVFQQRPEEASIYNILSTALCILTMPAMLWLYQLLFV